MSKFCIISVFDDNIHEGATFRQLSEITSKSIIDYCNLHGYDYKIECNDLDRSRHISWSKMYLAIKYLKDYDYVWCVDSDVMIMNHTIRLENIVDPNFNIMVALQKDILDSLSTGSIIYKNTPWTNDFLKEVYQDTEFSHISFFEQSSMIKQIRKNPSLINKEIKFVHHRLFNAYYHEWYEEENFRFGDFALHCAGTSNQYRLKLFQFLQDKIIKPINYQVPFKKFLNVGD